MEEAEAHALYTEFQAVDAGARFKQASRSGRCQARWQRPARRTACSAAARLPHTRHPGLRPPLTAVSWRWLCRASALQGRAGQPRVACRATMRLGGTTTSSPATAASLGAAPRGARCARCAPARRQASVLGGTRVVMRGGLSGDCIVHRDVDQRPVPGPKAVSFLCCASSLRLCARQRQQLEGRHPAALQHW